MFKVGDKVRAFGVDGVVIGINEGPMYPVHVDFGNRNINSFTSCGNYQDWHKEPSLVLVERADKFEEVVGYVPVKTTVYETKEEALAQPKAVGYREIKYFRKVEL